MLRLQSSILLPIQCSLQMLMGYVEVIVGVLAAGKRVGAPSMLAQELTVLVLFGIFFCAQKQHVLAKMSQTSNV